MKEKLKNIKTKLKRKRNPLKKKKLRFSSVIMVTFSLFSLYFFAHIVHWYFSGESTTALLSTINEDEVVGVTVPQINTSASKVTEKKFPFIAVDFKELKERNMDTAAWLKVNAVDVSMPIVQTLDNDFYLNHDIDKKKNNLGWVFADARSNLDYLGTNSVLYGHNTGNKQMFGSLKNIFSTDPEKKSENEIIQLTTPTTQMVFEIVSVYVTTFEDWKYVQHTFPDDESKREFVERMKAKNSMPIFARDDLSLHDSFLTFSTCYGPAGTSDRLVIHARLVAQQPNY